MSKTLAFIHLVFGIVVQIFVAENLERSVLWYGFGRTFFVFMEKICSFFGHRDVFCDLKKEIIAAVEVAINEYGINTFYVGDRGEFDRQAAGVVRSMKSKYPYIKLILVLPYLTNKLNEYKEIYESEYDEIWIPEQLMDIHPKVAITLRNRIMVNNSELIICYIKRDYGGAQAAIKYAKKQNKKIININKDR